MKKKIRAALVYLCLFFLSFFFPCSALETPGKWRQQRRRRAERSPAPGPALRCGAVRFGLARLGSPMLGTAQRPSPPLLRSAPLRSHRTLWRGDSFAQI